MDGGNSTESTAAETLVQAHTIRGGVHVHRARAEFTAPHGLPAVSRHFVGRDVELARLTELAATSSLCVIDGAAGVGKTALAVRWGNQAADLFPDGLLYVNLRGYTPGGEPMDVAHAAGLLLTALQVSAGEVPDDLDARTALLRDLLHHRRVLLVLDNAKDSDQILPLLPGAGSCLVLVTSRKRLSALHALHGAERLRLGPLPRAHSRHLFERYLGMERVAREWAVVDLVARRCGDLPLALSIAAAWVSLRPSARLPELAADLADERTRLGSLTLDSPATDVRAVLSWSYELLPAPTARVLRLLSLHPGDSVRGDTAAAITGLPTRAARAALDELCAHNLLTETADDRFQLHDLLRAYARERCAETETEAERAAAANRLLDHYLHAAVAADRQLNSHRRPIALTEPPPAGTLPRTDTYAAAVDWFTAEVDNALAVARTAPLPHAWQLPWAMVNFLYLRGRWRDSITAHEAALGALEQADDESPHTAQPQGATGDALPRTLQSLARAHSELGQYEQACARYSAALLAYQRLGDGNGSASALNGRGGSHLRLGRHTEALTDAAEALSSYQARDDVIGRASTLNLIGRIRAAQGNPRAALRLHSRALRLFRAAGDDYGQANTLDAGGRVLTALRRPRAAACAYGRALLINETLGNHYYLALCHTHLAETLKSLSHNDAARSHTAEAVRILATLDHPHAHELLTGLHPD
ncbi:tetratricopeptide repeat protein [Actinokineospora sp. NBRC 105648]|uniref:ATP-binding protein n=1 Tax=Actinokineospora sp. NBRC 105648 TaxID=3032206 RepID=UPI0024A02CBB|nr:tetratricopeptide repeat protein [Actinokineospora sp. NBRC 105648]GLZ43352.1 hypothetical protein Acsp05_69760 [Actinokineospora sp. NBRC 105648]